MSDVRKVVGDLLPAMNEILGMAKAYRDGCGLQAVAIDAAEKIEVAKRAYYAAEQFLQSLPAECDDGQLVCTKLIPGYPCPVPESCAQNGCSAVERELVARQPVAQPSPARVVGDPVAWRHAWGENCVVYSGWADAPVKEWAFHFVESMPGARIELAYLNPAPCVPAGLIEALSHQRQVDEDGDECGVSRQAVDVAIAILKSLPQQAAP